MHIKHHYSKSEMESKMIELRQEFRHLEFGALAIQKLIDQYNFYTVLDIGAGSGKHSEIFTRHGKRVTSIDYGKSEYFANKNR